MSRARMLIGMGLVAVIVGLGCQLEGVIWSWDEEPSPARNRRLVSTPVEQTPGKSEDHGQAVSGGPQAAGDADDPLARQIEQSYDRDEHVSDTPASSHPDRVEQVAASSNTPDPGSGSTKTAPGRHGEGASEPSTTITYEPIGVRDEQPGAGDTSPSNGAMPAPAHAAQGPRVELVDVRPAARQHRTEAAESPSASANQSTASAIEINTPRSLADLLTQLEDSVCLHPEHLDDRLKLSLLYLITGQEERVTEPAEVGDPVRSALLTALLDTVLRARHVIQNPSVPPDEALLATGDLSRLLSQRCTVLIPKIELVTRVGSFGDYDPIQPRRFPAGRENRFFVYTEVCNFRSEPTTDGKLLTRLAEQVAIYDDRGNVIWERNESTIEDRVRSPRRDFFVPFPVHLPVDTPAGDYILKVRVEDKLAQTFDEQRITFSIHP